MAEFTLPEPVKQHASAASAPWAGAGGPEAEVKGQFGQGAGRGRARLLGYLYGTTEKRQGGRGQLALHHRSQP